MKATDKGLKVIQGSRGQGASRLPSSRVQIIAAAVGLVVLLVGAARTLPQLDVDRANDAAVQPKAEAQAEPTAIDYFPAQFVNQAKDKEVEEHIQAF